MKRIFKYTLPVSPGPHTVSMPFGAKVLDVDIQGSDAVREARIWAIVDTNAEMKDYDFFVLMTGQVCQHLHYQHMATLKFDGGSHVVHIFSNNVNLALP